LVVVIAPGTLQRPMRVAARCIGGPSWLDYDDGSTAAGPPEASRIAHFLVGFHGGGHRDGTPTAL